MLTQWALLCAHGTIECAVKTSLWNSNPLLRKLQKNLSALLFSARVDDGVVVPDVRLFCGASRRDEFNRLQPVRLRLVQRHFQAMWFKLTFTQKTEENTIRLTVTLTVTKKTFHYRWLIIGLTEKWLTKIREPNWKMCLKNVHWKNDVPVYIGLIFGDVYVINKIAGDWASVTCAWLFH